MSYIGSQPATNFETVRKQVSTTNSGTTITLDYSVSSVQDILVTVNAVVQSYDNYSVSGTTLTLGGTLNNDRVEILYVGRTFQTVTPAVGTVTNEMLSGSIANSKLANSSITLNGSAVSLGGSLTGIGEDNTPYFLANGTGTQSLTENVNTTLQFNALRDSLDSASGYNTSSYTYTVQSGGAGFWYLAASSYVQSISQDKQVDIAIYINGAEWFVNRYRPGASVNQFVQIHAIHKLTVGNALLVKIFHNDSGARNAVLNSNSSFFGGYRIKEL